MLDILKKWRKLIRNVIIVVVALGLLYWFVLSVPINRLSLQDQLTTATAKWEARSIAHYRIAFDLGIPLQLLKTRFSMIVKNGQIEDVRSKPLVSLIDRNYNPDTVSYTAVSDQEIKLLHLSGITVEGMYQFASSASDRSSLDGRYDFEFDSQYGYISQVNEVCSGSISDCGFYYRVIQFEPIPDT